MQIRRLTAAAVAGPALVGPAGCRTSPSVAAYVGDDARITVDEVDDAVAERLADPDIAAHVQDQQAAYVRQVLSLRVDEAVYASKSGARPSWGTR